MTKPTPGRIVHYIASQQDGILVHNATYAAIVTCVSSDDTIDITVFCPGGATTSRLVVLGDSPTPGQAHWPPR
jgi:hypothetical protein